MRGTRILLRAAAQAEKPNITGFSMREFKKASGPPRYDPWERHEAWRYQGHFTRFNRFKNAFPGLGIASVAFAGYCAFEYFFLKNDHHGHGEGHAEQEGEEGAKH